MIRQKKAPFEGASSVRLSLIFCNSKLKVILETRFCQKTIKY